MNVEICKSCFKNFNTRNIHKELCYNCTRNAKRLALRISAANYKNNCCEICGLKRNTLEDLDIFDYHHKNRNDKSFEISEQMKNKPWEIVKQELDKCMMLCANCHRKQHYYQRENIIIKYANIFTEKYI